VKLHQWREFPRHVREHLSQRLKDRGIRADDLDKLRVWVESEPDVPELRGLASGAPFAWAWLSYAQTNATMELGGGTVAACR
jgi:hypothetical protein